MKKTRGQKSRVRVPLSVTHFIIKQILRAIELAPPFPFPLTGLCRGRGSRGSFQRQAVALVMAMKQ
jgi:hypothetical protein